MSTGIEWTDETWNPVSGCTKVSPGCDHCYAETLHERFHGKGSFATVNLHSERLAKPLTWRKPRRVFVNSMSDLFHADVPVEFIAEAFAVMAVTPQHTYQILTKRHARMRAVLRMTAFQQQVQIRQRAGVRPTFGFTEAWPLPNVWLGVSVETQQWADIRVPALLDTPAAVRFLSCEPLLGPVDLARYVWDEPSGLKGDWQRGIDWVIVGGESGPHARPMHPLWPRQLRDQCAAAGVPFFFKQWGEWQDGSVDLNKPDPRDHVIVIDGRHEPWDGHTRDGGMPNTDLALARYRNELGSRNGAIVSRVGKKAAGRELDGRTWDQYPQAVTT